MKVAVLAAAFSGACGFLVCFVAGYVAGARRSWRRRLRELGLNQHSAVLYVRAVKVLDRLHRQADPAGAGDLGCDRLAPETKAEISRWAVDYRIEAGRAVGTNTGVVNTGAGGRWPR